MLRPYTSADLGDLLDVWYRASLIAHAFLPEEFLATEQRQIAEQWLPMAETFVYESDGRVVGFLSLIGNDVGAIFVDPDHQGRGIGRALMDRARDSRPYLELDVFEANAIGRRFYDAYGFAFVNRHIHEASGQPSCAFDSRTAGGKARRVDSRSRACSSRARHGLGGEAGGASSRWLTNDHAGRRGAAGTIARQRIAGSRR